MATRLGPQNRIIWAFDGSSILTELRKLCGHDSIGPRGVRDQSISRIKLPISPPPVSQSARAGAIAFSPPQSIDNLLTADLIRCLHVASISSMFRDSSHATIFLFSQDNAVRDESLFRLLCLGLNEDWAVVFRAHMPCHAFSGGYAWTDQSAMQVRPGLQRGLPLCA